MGPNGWPRIKTGSPGFNGWLEMECGSIIIAQIPLIQLKTWTHTHTHNCQQNINENYSQYFTRPMTPNINNGIKSCHSLDRERAQWVIGYVIIFPKKQLLADSVLQ